MSDEARAIFLLRDGLCHDEVCKVIDAGSCGCFAAIMEKFSVIRAEATLELRVENERLGAAVLLVQRGIRAGKIKDWSIIPKTKPTDTSIEPIALSSIIDAALSCERTRSGE